MDTQQHDLLLSLNMTKTIFLCISNQTSIQIIHLYSNVRPLISVEGPREDGSPFSFGQMGDNSIDWSAVLFLYVYR